MERFGRRALLRTGAIAGLGLGWGGLLAARQAHAAAAGSSFGRAKRCILLFPFGGPSQIDTFDPKPDAPAGIRGEFRPIETNASGIRFTELFPALARRADKLAVVRSVTHHDAVHTSAGYWMLTGHRHPKANDLSLNGLAPPTPDDRPHVGAILAKLRPGPAELPTYVNLPELVKDAAINEVPGQGPGFLGGGYAPVLFQGDRHKNEFPPPDVFAPPDLAPDRIDARRALWARLAASDDRMNEHYRRAFDLMTSPAARRAFDLGQESPRAREAYGPHLFGQGCLLARRLIEAGVPLVTVYWHYEGPEDSPSWDTHEKNAKHLRERLAPPADQAVAALLDDLATRGLLEETLVVWMGEFGRSPKVNSLGGREHWPHVQTVLLAGGGVRGGQAIGASDRYGGHPADSPQKPSDVAATILHALGVRPGATIPDRRGLHVPACDGTPIEAAFA